MNLFSHDEQCDDSQTPLPRSHEDVVGGEVEGGDQAAEAGGNVAQQEGLLAAAKLQDVGEPGNN